MKRVRLVPVRRPSRSSRHASVLGVLLSPSARRSRPSIGVLERLQHRAAESGKPDLHFSLAGRWVLHFPHPHVHLRREGELARDEADRLDDLVQHDVGHDHLLRLRDGKEGRPAVRFQHVELCDVFERLDEVHVRRAGPTGHEGRRRDDDTVWLRPERTCPEDRPGVPHPGSSTTGSVVG